jgi:hypothetical protein
MKVPVMLRRPELKAPVAVDGLEPLTEGAEETWGEWTRWYLERHSSPLNRAAHLAGYALIVSALPIALLRKRWWLFPAIAGAGLATIAAGHAFQGNMPTMLAEPQRFFGKPLAVVRQGLQRTPREEADS